MLNKFLVITSLFFVSCSSVSEKTENPEPEARNSELKTLNLTFAGDLLLDRGVRDRIDHLGIESLFDSSIDSVFTTSDWVIANLECPSTTIKEPINKKYIFRSEPEWLSSLKKHGITHLNLANNHSMDQGRNGLVDTDKNIKESRMIPLGFGINEKAACDPFLIASNPRNVYLLSSLQVPSENWTYLAEKPCVCEEPFGQIINKVKAIKEKDSNSVVIVQLHWGIEHVFKPNNSQKQIAHELVDVGTDCIIGHHPHVVQSIEYYKGTPIFYSIGNFIFDQSKPINSRGLLIDLEITDSSIVADTIPFQINNCKPVIL